MRNAQFRQNKQIRIYRVCVEKDMVFSRRSCVCVAKTGQSRNKNKSINLKIDNVKLQVKVEAGVMMDKLNKILYDNNMALSVYIYIYINSYLFNFFIYLRLNK